MSWPAALSVIIWGAWVSLDERTWGSWAIHQPIVAGTVTGLLLGDPAAGLAAGVVFQALWPGQLPIGGSALPACGLAAVTAAAFCALGRHGQVAPMPWPGNPLLLPACIAGLAAAWAGELSEGMIRRRNRRRESEAVAVWPDRPERLERAFRLAMMDGAGRGVVIAGAGLALAWASGASGLSHRIGAEPWMATAGGILPLGALGLCLGSAGRWFGAVRRVRPMLEISCGLVAGLLLRLLVLRP